MKLIDRFVSRELIVNLLFAIFVLSLVLVVGNIFRKLLPLLVNHDVPVEYLVSFIAYVLPFSLIFTIPWGLLTAILLVFGRLSADNELIALRSNGVSVPRVCVSLAFLALVCTGMLEAKLPNKRILMRLYDARYQQRDEKNPLDLRKIRDGISMAEGTLPISLDELYEKEKKRPSRSALSITQLVDQLKSANKRERSASRTELNKRFSFPFSCVAFALVGVPLGVTAHRRETTIGFLLSLVIAISYFLFVIIADTLRNNPRVHPELLVWFPNVLFIVLGAVLFVRLSKR